LSGADAASAQGKRSRIPTFFWLRHAASELAWLWAYLFLTLVVIALIAICYFLAEVLPKL